MGQAFYWLNKDNYNQIPTKLTVRKKQKQKTKKFEISGKLTKALIKNIQIVK